MSKHTVQLIDLNIGNQGSLRAAFRRLGLEIRYIRNATEFNTDEPIVLPGVGAFGSVALKAQATGVAKWLKHKRSPDQPILGICLGMQLLANGSEENGQGLGLGIIPGYVHRLKANLPRDRVPNTGWRQVNVTVNCPCVFANALDKKTFYHIHSYYFLPKDNRCTYGTIQFNDANIPVVVGHRTAFGVQFHPEKSQEDGLDLLAVWRDGFFSFEGATE